MLLSEFLKSVDLSGLLLHTKKVESQKESYYVLRLRDTSLIQRYIVIHQDHTRTRRCSLSIDSYYHTLTHAMYYLEGVEGLIREKVA